MSEAEFNDQAIRAVGAPDIAALKRRAAAAPRGRYRLCLHHDAADAIQEMVICVRGYAYFRPHRHPSGRSESYHVIEGRLGIVFFDDAGAPTERLVLGAPGEAADGFMYRLSAPRWHFVAPLGPWTIYHETLTGPWDREAVVEEAPFAPAESAVEAVAAFARRHVEPLRAAPLREAAA